MHIWPAGLPIRDPIVPEFLAKRMRIGATRDWESRDLRGQNSLDNWPLASSASGPLTTNEIAASLDCNSPWKLNLRYAISR